MTTIYPVTRIAPILVACSLVVLLNGCSSNKESVIPNDGVPIEDVYYDQVPAAGDSSHARAEGKEHWVLKRPATYAELDKNPYVLRNTLEPVFKKLENPTLYIFSFPYLSGSGRVPVPAYISEMKMFERDEYAQPGEVNLNIGER